MKKADQARHGRTRPLTQGEIVDAAFTVVARAGLEGLTLRSLAAELGISNPSLYWHFANKQQIVDAMAHRLVEASAVTIGPDDDWRSALERFAGAFRDALASCRDGARIVATADLRTDTMAARLEPAVRLLHVAGLSSLDALLAILAIGDYTLGATFESEEDPSRSPETSPDPERDASRFPELSAALEQMAAKRITEDDTFASGVRLILDGISVRISR